MKKIFWITWYLGVFLVAITGGMLLLVLLFIIPLYIALGTFAFEFWNYKSMSLYKIDKVLRFLVIFFTILSFGLYFEDDIIDNIGYIFLIHFIALSILNYSYFINSLDNKTSKN